jgi:hypothetical protein
MSAHVVAAVDLPEFFQSRALVLLRRSRIAEPKVAEYHWQNSPYALANACEFEKLTARYSEQLRRAETAELCLKDLGSPVGWGVFSIRPLAVDDLIGEYTGVIQGLTEAPAHQLVDGHYLSDYAWNYPDELPDGTEFEVNAFSEGNVLRFVNHSASPNCAVDHTLVDGLFVTFFRVIQPIAAGDQLFVDYGEAYWSGGYRSVVDL